MVIRRFLARVPTRLLVLACCASALAAGAVGWYATRPVAEECLIAFSRITSADDPPPPPEGNAPG